MKNALTRLFIVDDDDLVRKTLRLILEDRKYSVSEAANGVEAINILQNAVFDVVLLDLKMPKINGLEVLDYIQQHCPLTQAIILTAVMDIPTAIEALKRGAYHYITKPYSEDDLLPVIERAIERRRLLIENELMKTELLRLEGVSEIIGSSPNFQRALQLAAKVAPSDSSVLIHGESGTGKELIAKFIHRNSGREKKPFVVFNCAAFSDTLIESELFGHEKGAFTDAIQTKPGLLEIADGGTIFLDEVGDLSLAVQPKILRFLQEGEFRRLGGNMQLYSDVRVISATNKNLDSEVSRNTFREDLLYRLNVITIHLPPMRERREDIPQLVQWFIKKKSRGEQVKSISEEALSHLTRYHWPGNVRELQNVIERAVILSTGDEIDVSDLVIPVTGTGMQITNAVTQSSVGRLVSMKDIEREHYSLVLNTLNWNKPKAAEVLGVSLKTLYTKIQQHQLKEPIRSR